MRKKISIILAIVFIITMGIQTSSIAGKYNTTDTEAGYNGTTAEDYTNTSNVNYYRTISERKGEKKNQYEYHTTDGVSSFDVKDYRQSDQDGTDVVFNKGIFRRTIDDKDMWWWFCDQLSKDFPQDKNQIYGKIRYVTIDTKDNIEKAKKRDNAFYDLYILSRKRNTNIPRANTYQQLALWKNNNQEDLSEFDKQFGDKNKVADAAEEVLEEAKAFYKCIEDRIEPENKTEGYSVNIKDNKIVVGPLKINYNIEWYKNKLNENYNMYFTKYIESKLTDNNNVEIKNWNYCNYEGKTIAADFYNVNENKEKKMKTFYISIPKNTTNDLSNITLTIKFKQMHLEGEYFRLVEGGTQNLIGLLKSRRYYEEKNINIPMKIGADLKVVKTNMQGAKILGVTFELWKDKNKIGDPLTTNANGEVVFKGLPFGDYILKEVSRPENISSQGEAYGANGLITNKLDNIPIKIGTVGEVTINVKNWMNLEFEGVVFLDQQSIKSKPNGLLDDNDRKLEGIVVEAFDKNTGQPIGQAKKTDKNGHFKFEYKDNLSDASEYYFRFTYDGMKYEPTTYRVNDKDIDKLSKATEGKDNRSNFNKARETIDGKYTMSNNIYAYTGSDGKDILNYYGYNSSPADRLHINLGLLLRPTFDLAVIKDSVDFKLTVNNVSTVYPFDTVEENRNEANKVLEVKLKESDLKNVKLTQTELDNTDLKNSELKGSDLNPYIKYIRKSDLKDDTLKMEIKYRIKLYNTSNGTITGRINKIRDWYDKDLELEKIELKNSINDTSIRELKKDEDYKITGTKGTYNYVDIINNTKDSTKELKQFSLESGNYSFIEMTFKLDNKKLKDQFFDENGNILSEKELNEKGIKVRNNFTEIMSYSTYYTNKETDLKGNIKYAQGAIAGLVDVDSTPANFDPTSKEVVDFINECDNPADPKNPKYPAYEKNGKKGIERHKKTIELFEDDADRSPGVIIKVAPTERKISGTVFVDGASKSALKENERIGNGRNDIGELSEEYYEKYQEDLPAEGVIVTLWEDKGEIGKIDNADVKVKSVTSGADGTYNIEGFVPGKYYLTYEYGTVKGANDQGDGTLKKSNMYNGQDYKSTLYYKEKYDSYLKDENDQNDRHSWWYVGKDAKTSDARDNWKRRLEINEQCSEIKNYKAETLNGAEDRLNDLEKLTKMTANTERLDIEVDCPIKTTDGKLEYDTSQAEKGAYNVSNINFGIIERPRNEIFLEEKVSRVLIISNSRSADVSNVLVDTNVSKTGVAWNSNTYDQGTRTRKIGNISITLDDSLRQGSTMYIYYDLTAENKGEVNYVDSSKKEIEQYYYRGEKQDQYNIAQTNTGEIINYLSNDLNFKEENNKNSEDKALWKVITKDKMNNEYSKPGTAVVDLEANYINNKIKSVKQLNTILTSTEDNKVANKDLRPGESVKEQLVLQQTLSSEGNQGPFENSTEVIKQKSDVGRRNYAVSGRKEKGGTTRVSIPGNLDPILAYDQSGQSIQGTEEEKKEYIAKFATIDESDSAAGEPVDVIPPFGRGRDYMKIVLIGVSIIVVMGVGVFVIKKKVL